MQHAGGARTELRVNYAEEMPSRGKSASTDQRNELLRRDQKRERVNKTEQAQNDEPCEPVSISAREKRLKEIIAIIHCRSARLTSKLMEVRNRRTPNAKRPTLN